MASRASTNYYDFHILNHIDEDPDITQSHLATHLGVAIGSINWYLKRLIKKGYIKVRQMQGRRMRYLLTPEGLAAKAQLTASFLHASLKWYRQTRQTTQALLEQVRQAGYDTVSIEGNSDLSEIVYLTCLEAQIAVQREPDPSCPRFRIDGLKTVLDWPEGQR